MKQIEHRNRGRQNVASDVEVDIGDIPSPMSTSSTDRSVLESPDSVRVLGTG